MVFRLMKGATCAALRFERRGLAFSPVSCFSIPAKTFAIVWRWLFHWNSYSSMRFKTLEKSSTWISPSSFPTTTTFARASARKESWWPVRPRFDVWKSAIVWSCRLGLLRHASLSRKYWRRPSKVLSSPVLLPELMVLTELVSLSSRWCITRKVVTVGSRRALSAPSASLFAASPSPATLEAAKAWCRSWYTSLPRSREGRVAQMQILPPVSAHMMSGYGSRKSMHAMGSGCNTNCSGRPNS
mmetsp:Transcript_32203/g.102437  ORF Transcript_32203/g.102437 Transcript_32203/m.102437 type:complete len:242 (+) Transcript_32203:994-1719(+)